ncbi:hypothetical protein EMCRGX_G029088 [Ephydatia muelleri]|eukprot:Em0013g715a
MEKKPECVKVIVRCRPMSKDEIADGYQRVVDMDVPRGTVALHKPKAKSDEPPREFTFDAVYDWNSKQRDLYDETFRPLVEAVLQGYNGTIFAYGQTGTGKTYTMEGNRANPEEKGVILNSFEHIYAHISQTHDEQYLVRASYLEIYQEEIRDLLSKDQKKRLELKERPDTGVYVKDLSSFITKSIKEIDHVMNVGNQNRTVGCTYMNQHSSRSHAIFILTIECCSRGIDGADHIRVGKLNMVDLAGSERQEKTGTTGERFKEATKINLSLSALGNVISSLVDGKCTHIPYRDSKLTRLLQDSLGGNAKTVMVANVGPADYNYEETLTTLRYADRAKSIKNKPKINEDPKDALLREYQEEIKKLKIELEKRKNKDLQEKQKLDGTGENGDAIVVPQEEQAKLQAEKEAILQNRELLQEERDKLVAQIQRRADQLKKDQKKKEALSEKIKAMENKLLAGGKNIVDRTDAQEKEIQKRRQEILEQKKREREIQQQLQMKEESTLEMKETFTSLQEEVDTKTKKLSKLKAKLKTALTDIVDYKEEQVRVREGLLLTLEDLQKDLKLRTLIVENFIPADDVSRFKQRAVFDEETEEWKLTTTTVPPRTNIHPTTSACGVQPVTLFALMAAKSGDPKYMPENVLKVELDLPNRTTRDYEGPVIAPQLQAALDAALEDDEELTIDATSFKKATSGLHKGPSKPSTSTVKLARSSTLEDYQKEFFPSSRGLVTSSVRFA